MTVDNVMTVANVKDLQTNELITKEEFDAAFVSESLESLTIANTSELTTENTSLSENTIQEPKKDIINYLKQGNGNFSYFSTKDKERNAKIREHIQKTLSWEKA
ncbi:MAG: hypothetical protein QNJ18_17310 [Xenococcaceae cyanobacterium MO_167.B52]|nr:hypothetical protein [Xenococcaceae cyanobacterium MO_167.B52]